MDMSHTDTRAPLERRMEMVRSFVVLYYSFPVRKVPHPFAAKTCQTAAPMLCRRRRRRLHPPAPAAAALHTTAPLIPPTAINRAASALGSCPPRKFR